MIWGRLVDRRFPFLVSPIRYLIRVKRVQRVGVLLQGGRYGFDFQACSGNFVGHRIRGGRARLKSPGAFQIQQGPLQAIFSFANQDDCLAPLGG